ncbi:MAG: DUF4956 domain-containing protein [Chlorobi bacterium]|nr:DUF4956 domain-containing protein [Chlorobiota bacterium]
MNKWQLFQKFLITQNSQIDTNSFIINSLVLVVLTILLEYTYYKCANTMSNKKIFAGNFILTAFTTMVIISIVKTSLALSLGLVGALSIVRYRAAIKEPEELSYLFFTIAVGLGMGANQLFVTVLASFILFAIVWGRFFISKKNNTYQNLFLTITQNPKVVEFEQIAHLINKYFPKNKLKRFDEGEDSIETSYYVDIKRVSNLQNFKNELRKLSASINIAFIDNHV